MRALRGDFHCELNLRGDKKEEEAFAFFDRRSN